MTREPDAERVRTVFMAVVDLPQEERAAAVARACGDDEALHREVVALLKHADTRARGRPDRRRNQRPLPARIGKFDVLDLLGEGGMGVVYVARNPTNGQLVAIKVLPSSDDPDRLEAFAREARLLAELDHPGIARTLDFFPTSDAGPFIVMELVDGVTLDVHCRELGDATPEATRERLDLLVQVCDAVEYAHRHGIIHQDLKPTNVMVDANGRAKVLDFGIAGRRGALEHAGTRPYMSPERRTPSASDVDTRSDVYSLGVTAYEIFTGRIPAGDDDLDLPTPPATHPGDLATVVTRAREADPGDRHANVAALRDDLRRVARRLPLGDSPSPRERLAHWTLRRPGSAMAAVTGAAAVIVVALLFADAAAETARARRAREAAEVLGVGQSYAQRGMWDQALDAFARAEAIGGVDPIALEIARIGAWKGQGDYVRARHAIEALTSRPDDEIAPFRGRLLLLRADRAADPRAKLRGIDEELVEAALAAGDLPVADRHYAEALVASTCTDVIEHLTRALENDPLHRASRLMLPPVYLFAGRVTDARGVADENVRVYPHDPMAQVTSVIVRIADGSPFDLDELLERAPDVSPSTRDGIRNVDAVVSFQRQAVAVAHHRMMRHSLGLPPPREMERAAMQEAFRVASAAQAGPDNGQLEAFVTLPPAIVRDYTRMMMGSVFATTGFMSWQDVLEHTLAMYEDYDEGIAAYLAATAAAHTGKRHLAAGLFHEATKRESIFDVRRASFAFQIDHDAKSGDSLDPERAERNIARYLMLDDLEPLELRFLASCAAAVGAEALHKECVWRWIRTSPGDADATDALAAR